MPKPAPGFMSETWVVKATTLMGKLRVEHGPLQVVRLHECIEYCPCLLAESFRMIEGVREKNRTWRAGRPTKEER